MVTTRSMSKTSMVTKSTKKKPTKKSDTKMDVNGKQKAAKRATNKAKSGTTKTIATEECTSKWTADAEAYLFFLRDRTQIPRGIIPKEVRRPIWEEWRNMSLKDKAPFLERAKKLKVEERFLYR